MCNNQLRKLVPTKKSIMKKSDNNLQCSVYAIFNEPKHERHVGFGLPWDLLKAGIIKNNISPIVLCLVLSS